jgi:ribosome biogenesis GTPase / thiamine phosphate phosphatase
MKGLVIKSTGSWYIVLGDDNQQYQCRLKGKFKIAGIKNTNPISVGDRVSFDIDDKQLGVIHELFPRHNYIIRKSTNLSKQSHIIAANIDQAVLVVSLIQPKTPLGFIDRFLATAAAYHIEVIIIINKVDLIQKQDDLDDFLNIYEKIGYNCIQTSAIQLTKVDELKKIFADKVILLSGQSGVGKTSLINAIAPGTNLKTASVSDYNEKGKHTTTFAEMILLEGNIKLIDTPGLRSFGLYDFDKNELPYYFLEIMEYGKNCKFSNCHHIDEPKCAVKTAVEEGKIAESRYANYLNIYFDKELDEKY